MMDLGLRWVLVGSVEFSSRNELLKHDLHNADTGLSDLLDEDLRAKHDRNVGSQLSEPSKSIATLPSPSQPQSPKAQNEKKREKINHKTGSKQHLNHIKTAF